MSIKTIQSMLKQDKERYTVPRKVQDVIPIRRIWSDGIFLMGNKFSKAYQFTDINYQVASREDKESMFLSYSELLKAGLGNVLTLVHDLTAGGAVQPAQQG